MYVPDTITTFMSEVCVWRGAANPAGSLNSAPNAPFAWLPHKSATLTPGAPGSRSVHLMSLDGMTTSRLSADFEAGFAAAFPDPCAKTVTGRATVITIVKRYLARIGSSVYSIGGRGTRRRARLPPRRGDGQTRRDRGKAVRLLGFRSVKGTP